MKTTINSEELRKLDACESGYKVFVKAHSEKTVKLSEALKSNGWDDIWWLIAEINNQLSDEQKRDLRLLGCDYAEDVLHLYEQEYDDPRPRNAIEVSRRFAISDATDEERAATEATAWATAWAAAGAARDAARAAAWAAAGDARDAAWTAAWAAAEDAWDAWDAARDAKKEWQEKQLMELFLRWENE